jgi:hypothetical protein
LQYEVDFRAIKWKWRADITFQQSERYPSGRIIKEFSNNGFQFITFNRWTGQAKICEPNVVQKMGGYIDEGLDLPTDYWLTMRGELISLVLEQAKDRICVLSRGEGDGKEEIVLRVPFGPEGPHHFIFRLSQGYDYAIKEAWWYANEEQVYNKMEAKRLEEVAPHAWAPREWTVGSPTNPKPDRYACTNIVVGQELPAAVFRIDPPDGAIVANNITGEAYQAGLPPGSGGFDQELLMKVRQAGGDEHSSVKPNRLAPWLFFGNAIALGCILFFLRRRRQRNVSAAR